MRTVLAYVAGVASLFVSGELERVLKAQSAVTLPATKGVEIVRARCLTCHDADLIVSQRLSAAAWEREVAKMERWGAKPEADERPALIGYLAREFGGRSVLAAADAALSAGGKVFQTACLSCHADDLPAQQRLSAAAWGREVDKMVRWGARVPADDKPALVTYLTSRWGPP